jgi:uncharacterized membrane protein
MPPSPENSSRPDALTTSRTVVGVFATRSRAQEAIRELRDAGFGPDQIGLAMHEQSRRQEPEQPSSADTTDAATVGALTGGVLGSLVGLIGSLLIPGLGPVLIGGVLASLVGAGIGAATGSIAGVLMDLGVPEREALHFDAALRAGGTLVTVHAGARTAEALGILQRHEADVGLSLTSPHD